MAPQEIAHYRITAKLGQGGMGEVYRARDSKLGREVAIKLLPPSLAADPDRMARFAREARLLAALNHPNIATIYGVEDSAGSHALVMELVEGETLDGRIAGKPVPVAEALPIARQVAEALDYAHQHGVIHRDLKPANIKITPDGQVKVLDFGLAKALADESPSSAEAANSPTLTLSATHVGVLLGTAAYMSPEQARGLPADKRADIWSFGVVLFEMLTGRQAFPGDTVSDSLAGVLKIDPDWQLLPAATPDRVRRLLQRCLTRDRKLRLRDIGDAIPELSDSPVDVATPIVAAPANRPPVWLAALAAISLIAALGLGWLLLRDGRKPVPSTPTVRFRVPLPADVNLLQTTHSSTVAVSADGRRIAFVARGKTGGIVFHRGVDSAEPIAIRGVSGESKSPFLSPDGQWVAFFNGGKLKKAPATGGQPDIVCDAPSGHGGSWNSQGVIVFTPSHTSGLSVVNERGGAIKVLTTPRFENGESGHFWPQFLPDDRTVLFTASRNTGATYDNARIEAVRIDTGERRVVVEGGYAARYLSSGRLVYVRRGVLVSAPFDLSRAAVTGPATQVLTGVRADALGPPDFDLSPNGLLAFAPGEPFVPESHFVFVDRAGASRPLSDIDQSMVDGPAFSPDGERIAFIGGTDQTDIWVYDRKRRVLTRMTNDGISTAPSWSADGRRIAYISRTPGVGSSLLIAPADGSGPPVLVAKRNNLLYNVAFRPDGAALAFSEYDAKTLFDIWLAPISGGAATPLFNGPGYEWGPVYAPDGRSIAYLSGMATGSEDLCIESLDTHRKWRVTTTGALMPAWSHDGRQLYFVSGRSLYVVSVAAGDDPEPGPPRLIMDNVDPSLNTTNRIFDVAPDGSGFVLAKPASARPPATSFDVIVNWRP